MQPHHINALEKAVDDLNSGHLETFLGLMSDDMVWSGYPRGILWWRERPH